MKATKQKDRYDRQYLGVTITASNYREILEKEGRDGINFHTRHLEAYLKGKKIFQFGYNRDKEGRAMSPKMHITKAKLTKINLVD